MLYNYFLTVVQQAR